VPVTDEQTTSSAVIPGDEQRWAELADLVLIVAREIQFRGYADKRAVPLSQSEGMVMRYLQQVPATTPSQIAAATGLQRTNLSAVLRSLEQKGLIERSGSSEDGRGVAVRPTELGKSNYALVRHEWADTVSSAAKHRGNDLDAAIALLRAIEGGLVSTRPRTARRTLE
jgi:DNA-binding MarR family transcriptional regulator